MEGDDPTNEVVGAVARIEERPFQLKFARDAGVETVMLDAYRAERLLDRGKTASTLFPEAYVILTTTFEDERLELWFLERELDVATRFGADVVVPCDVPIYETHSRQRRLQDLRVYIENVERAVAEFNDRGIAVIPLVKGETPRERQICYDIFDQLGITYVAFYCAQYFLYGFRYQDLLERVRTIVHEFDPISVMLVGFQSENLLPAFPPAVQAAAGFRWFWQSNLTNETPSVAKRNYEAWETEVNAALQTGQALLGSFTDRVAEEI